MIMDQVPFSFRQSVFGILKTLVVRASGNNLDLTYDVDPGIPDQLIGDSFRLQQVITNLVSNAIKFTPSGASDKGHVALSCRRIALDDSSVTLEFCVSDNGIGISKDKSNLIFDTLTKWDCSAIWVCAPLSMRFFFLLPTNLIFSEGKRRHGSRVVHLAGPCIPYGWKYVGRKRSRQG
jgi:Histidine kinase-, DNA gyrase B-, and HSP90-like ATPase